MKAPTIVTTFRSPGPMRARLDAEARRRGVPVGEVVRAAVAAYLPENEDGPAGDRAVGTSDEKTPPIR